MFVKNAFACAVILSCRLGSLVRSPCLMVGLIRVGDAQRSPLDGFQLVRLLDCQSSDSVPYLVRVLEDRAHQGRVRFHDVL